MTSEIKKVKKPIGYKRILTFESYKTSKSKAFGYLTGILYMSPGNESGVINMCVAASPECLDLCLGKSSGQMQFSTSKRARIWRTRLYVENPALFFACLEYDMYLLKRQAAKLGLTPVFRANGTSDFPKIAYELMDRFPNDLFYDYTKLDRPWARVRTNYHLTFSYSGHNLAACMNALRHGINVAVVFDTRKGEALPNSWQGYKVLDGDTHDLRFLDPQSHIVGLRAKGKAKKMLDSAFVVAAKSTLFVMAA